MLPPRQPPKISYRDQGDIMKQIFGTPFSSQSLIKNSYIILSSSQLLSIGSDFFPTYANALWLGGADYTHTETSLDFF